ncbi:MAG: carbohydrate-binding family 9-like protein [Oscillospiraceae bacterium]|nr:carbohydrate-binding family 9-like protein [Oscillospiraceae bacterium]
MKYTAPLYKNGTPQGSLCAPTAQITSWHWEEAKKYRPKVYCSICAVEDDYIFAWLSCFEWHRREVCIQRDDPVYEDSCLELFLAPKDGDERYINIEVNPKGVYLSQFGTSRDDRVFLKEITGIEPKINTLSYFGKWWLARIELPVTLLQALYGEDFCLHDGQKMRGNFYKCGDKTRYPHWGAWSAVTDNPPGFHNPKCFGEIVVANQVTIKGGRA